MHPDRLTTVAVEFRRDAAAGFLLSLTGSVPVLAQVPGWLPFTEGRMNPLGVIHKAEIVNPSEAERQIVNSTMLVVGDVDEIGREQQREFVATDKISQKVY